MTIIFLLICLIWIIRGCVSEKRIGNDNVNPQTSLTETTDRDTLVADVPLQDNFEIYHNNLNKSTLSFDEVRKMMEKAKADNLIELNKQLYDTLNVYSEFVRLYKEEDQCYLKN